MAHAQYVLTHTDMTYIEVTFQNGYAIVKMPDGKLLEWDMETAKEKINYLNFFDETSLKRITQIKIPITRLRNATDTT